jgi:hypothetical protein
VLGVLALDLGDVDLDAARISSAGDAMPDRRRSEATRCIERASSSASCANWCRS